MKFAIFTDPHFNAFKDKLSNFCNYIKDNDQNLDGYICAGDWCSGDVLELELIFKTIRDNTSKPILTVFGNHDIWNKTNLYNLDEIFTLHNELCEKYQIINLEKDSFETSNSLIIGFMGWYNVYNTNNTVDYDYIPRHNTMGLPSYHFLKKRELDGMYRIIDHVTDKQKICITHFGFRSDLAYKDYQANEKHSNVLSDHCSKVIYGHSHKKDHFIINNCNFYNSGADYLKNVEDYIIILDL